MADEIVPPEECGFCRNGVFCMPPRLIECPYCEGTGKQLPPSYGNREGDDA